MDKLNSTTYKQVAKDNPKDLLVLEVGDSKDLTKFQPQVKICKWGDTENDNECNVSIRLKEDKDELKEKATIVEEDGKIKYKKSKREAHFYDIAPNEEHPEGAFETEIILLEKPDTNVVEFTIVDKDVEYFYQPALTPEEIEQGSERPDNVIGSYAIYAKTPKTNWAGGKEYKVGKVGHIYRPRIIDAEGTEVWGDLHIENGILSVTIPQDFLDKAVYPVRHAAGLTFGYESQGASNDWLAALEDGGYFDERQGNSLQVQYLTTDASPWTIPTGVTSIIAECWGGGGAGGGANGTQASGGGGAGAYARKTFSGLTPGNTITFSVGASVAGDTDNGANGNPTWFSSNDSSGCVAAGGDGGVAGNPGTGGTGGSLANSYGDTEYAGGNGSNGSGAGGNSGAGGGGAGSTGTGNNASGTTRGPLKDEHGGVGGGGRTTVGGGAAGGIYGGGGGGAKRASAGTYDGGAGGTGLIRITWATGASGTLDNIKAYIGGDNPVDVKAILNKLHGTSYGFHSQIASIESLDVAAAAGWKTFTASSEALTVTDTYVLSVVGNSADLSTDPNYVLIYGDSVGRFAKFHDSLTYASPETPWGINSSVGSSNLKFSIYATYTAAASGPANLKSRSGNLKANIKSMSGNLIANIKSLSGNS